DYFMNNEISPELVLNGESTGLFFGFVSSAGDVNGDGFDDIIVGTSFINGNTGKVYLFLGGVSMNNIADAAMSGETSNSKFGFSLSSAGDVNGDGYSDIIVGANNINSGTGKAYIYFGGNTPDTISDVIMTGETAFDYFGTSVSDAGDVNGDGYADVIVGANGYSNKLGRTYIYYGGAIMNNVSDVTMTGDSISTELGYSVSGAGDVNGDGYADVLAGGNKFSNEKGRAFIFFGGNIMNNVADVRMTGENSGDNFGISVSDAGDVNKDGFSDVIVGANQYNSYTGKVYIFYGGNIMDNTADVIITGESTGNFFGNSVSSAGDINADGYSDVVIGAFGYSSNKGRAFILFGGANMNNTADVFMTGENDGDRVGISVSGAGDLNGDGFSDIVIGVIGINTSIGAAFIYTGSSVEVKPNILYVKDVPNDQGGKVNLKWVRSGYDVQGNNLITDYLIQRSFPPSGGSFSWQNVSVVPASHESFYTYIDNTLFDSSSNNSGNFFYRITARTSDINQSWKSNILAGRSIDNISPPMVSPFNAIRSGANVILNWNRNPALDLFNYILFRNINPTIDPYTETPYAAVTDSVYTDTSPLGGNYYYFIVAQDIHNNYSPVAVTTSPAITLNLTMFIEGFYSEFGDSQVADRINVFLRNSASPYSLKDSALTEVQSDGSAILQFNNASSGNFYIAIKHRNSIETWSSAGVSVTAGGSVGYNFSGATSQAFGNNLIQIDTSPVRFGIYSGDVNQDGTIDLADGSLIDNDAFNFESGYLPTDLNGDGVIDLADAVFADNNAFNFVSAVTP
ncbi:MAG: FG-GAP repeat protein, partial [Ignavibacteria bacterium]|nr:FG-GAP repeat protein [Ignavibacteria bacterium]